MNTNKKSQYKIGIKLVIESDKKYELPFLEMTIDAATDLPSIQVYPNIFIPNQSGANIVPEDELSCAVLLKLHTYERNKEWIGLNEYKNYRKKKNIPELPKNNADKTLNSLLNSKYQNQYKSKLNEGVANNSFLSQSNNKKKVYHDKIRALYEKCKVFYRKEHDNSFQEKKRMYGLYENRENIKGNDTEMVSRLKNGIRIVKKVSSIDYVPKTVYSSKFTDKKDGKIEFSNRFSIQPHSSNIDPFHNTPRHTPFIKLTSFDFLPHSYHVQDGPKSPLFLSDIEKLNTGEYVLQFPINPDNEYKVQLPFLATKSYMIIVKPAKDQQQLSPNTITLYEMDVQNDSNQNRKKRRILTTSSPSNGPTKEYKFYRHKVKLETVIETYMSIVDKGMTYVCPVSVFVFNEISSASA